MDDSKAVVLIFNNNGIGQTSEQALKDKLTKTFLTLALQNPSLPRAICFYTDGVKMACEGSPVLDELRSLEDKGVRLVLCQTCLDYFGLKDKVQVGIIGGMGDIITTMWQADSVITV
jgi:sulfur relay (sulfurtransferase) complex TusBCD TusD component (DsrE family)